MRCTKCQLQLPDDANFCFKCGHKLFENEQLSIAKPAPDAERKRVTAVFSDLSGYTAMTGKLDPEDIKEIRNSIFDGIKRVVKKYEGFIENFVGDGVLALFGVPRAHEDDPTRAIRAVLEIHEFVQTLSPQYQIKSGCTLSMHSGVNTGVALTADVNPEKGTHGVIGEFINVAARLSDLATAGEILIGSETYLATQHHFAFQAIKPTKLKGKSDPVQIYKLISNKARTFHIRQKIQVSSKMIGRDQQLAKLELIVLKAANGQGSVVNVFGEPGIGKSRLMAELRQREIIKRVSFLEGRSISIGKNLSFHPINDLLKQWAKIKEEDTNAEASNKLENAIRRICIDEADEIFPFLAKMMGIRLSGNYEQRIKDIEGEALEKLIFKNVRELLIRSAAIVPVVIVMEDLHWADRTSLKMLMSLFRLTETHRIVFINVFRPGYWEVDEIRIEALSEWLPDVDFTEVAVKPLNKQMGEDLVNNMLKVSGLPNAIKHQILERAGGNPFFIEEIVRSLIDEGAIVKECETLIITEKMDYVVIPATINDVIIARMDRLEVQTRELVKIASVIGRSFFDKILKEVAGSIEEIDTRLGYLKDAQLIRDHIRMGELEYLFKHALAQEAAYESTLIQQRKLLHLKIAESIEYIFQDRLHEFYGMLAYHYNQGQDLEKAEEYMTKAGEEALNSSASSEALDYYQEALKLYLRKHGDNTDQLKIANYEKNIGLALYNKGSMREAVRYFDNVMSRWGAPLPKMNLFGIARLMWDMWIILKVIYLFSPNSKRTPGNRDIEIFDLYHKASLSLTLFDNFRVVQVIMCNLKRTTKFELTKIPRVSMYWSASAGIFSASGFLFRLSNRLLHYAHEVMDFEGPGSRMAYACMSTASTVCQGNWEKINHIDEDLVDQSLKMGDFYHSSLYLWFYGLVKGEQGKFDRMVMVFNKLYDIGETYGHHAEIILSYGIKSKYFVKARHAHEAVIAAEKGIAYCQDYGSEINQIMLLGSKIEAQLLAGNIEGAQESILLTSKMIKRQTLLIMPLYLAPYLTARFFVAIEQLKISIRSGESSDLSSFKKYAFKVGKEAVRNSRKYAPFRTNILRLMGEFHWVTGKPEKAIKWWKKAITEGERLCARPDLSRTYYEVGKRLLEPQSKYKELNGTNGKQFLDKARIMFQDMSMQWDLAEMDNTTVDY